MKKLIAGNWKMNGNKSQARALIADIINGLHENQSILDKVEILVCPPMLHIGDVRHALFGFPDMHFGAQDVSAQESGAYTGDISVEMLNDAGCGYVIVGHSERRQYHDETDADVAAKASAILAKDMVPIICVGETLEEREAGKAKEVVGEQMRGSLPSEIKDFQEIVIAYEPVWAIGTGKTASAQDAEDMHAFIRGTLKAYVQDASKVRILYGGSMKPENAEELLACKNIDGGLIGGASLKAESFLSIAKAA
ncbi:MAG: triose-phosphate isomerase [Micavibrio sp.]|nr:triose-phosphate isomerase [Micavibrio sp.]